MITIVPALGLSPFSATGGCGTSAPGVSGESVPVAGAGSASASAGDVDLGRLLIVGRTEVQGKRLLLDGWAFFGRRCRISGDRWQLPGPRQRRRGWRNGRCGYGWRDRASARRCRRRPAGRGRRLHPLLNHFLEVLQNVEIESPAFRLSPTP